MLASPFMGMGPMNPYLGHLPLPMMGSVPQMPLPGGAVSSPQTPSKPLFASSSSPSSSNSASKPAFAAYGYMSHIIFVVRIMNHCFLQNY